jgi:putative acetyltransferase
VRPYQADDYQKLISFLKGAFSEMGNEFLPDGKDSDIRDIDRVYLQNTGSFYVIDGQGEICGCVGVRKFSDEAAELKRLYVAQKCRGRGLGQVLCLNAIRDACGFGYKFLRLDTTTKSKAALALFKKLGFSEIGRYNSDPFAEIFMERVL